MYYLKYTDRKNDDNPEIKNLKNAIDYASNELLENGKINLLLINHMHEQLLQSVRRENKEPGKLRTVQNWIGPSGCTIEEVDFIPPQKFLNY